MIGGQWKFWHLEVRTVVAMVKKRGGGRLPILMVGITRRLNKQGRGYWVKKIMALIGIEVHERESESVTNHSVQGSVR